MANFRVHLKSLLPGSEAEGGNSGWGEGTMYVIGQGLKKLFDDVCTESKEFTQSDYRWPSGTPAPESNEIVIHFLSDEPKAFSGKTNSIIQSAGISVPHQTAHGSVAGGTAVLGQRVVSEVYVNRLNGDANFVGKLVALAFHEAMHNQLDVVTGKNRVVNNLHASGGGGFAAAKVDHRTKLTKRNKELMARALPLKIPQFGSTERSPYP